MQGQVNKVGGWSTHCDLPGSFSLTWQTQHRHCHARRTNSKLQPHSWNQLHLPLQHLSVKFNIHCLAFRHKFLVYHMLFINTSSISFWFSIFEIFLASRMILFSIPCSDILFQDHIETDRTWLLVSSNAGIEKIWTVLFLEVWMKFPHVQTMCHFCSSKRYCGTNLMYTLLFHKYSLRIFKKCLLVNTQFIVHQF